MTYEGLRLKVLRYWRIGLANYRNKQLENKWFTIISNNCWGGMIYESYNLPKESPTIGMFFMAEDYIKFIFDMRGYFSTELTFIGPEKSKWKEAPQVSGDKRFGSYPIGRLKDIEIFFLHYHSEEEAKEKWERRIKRINWERMLIKFNDQNGCTEKEVKAFMELPYKNKLFFTCKDNFKLVGGIVVKQFPKREYIMASYEPFGKSRYIDMTKLLNSL